MALGGSTNTVLHLMAVAEEANVPLSLDDFNEISDTVPHICYMQPSGPPHSMETLYYAGGIPAVLHALAPPCWKTPPQPSPVPASPTSQPTHLRVTAPSSARSLIPCMPAAA